MKRFLILLLLVGRLAAQNVGLPNNAPNLPSNLYTLTPTGTGGLAFVGSLPATCTPGTTANVQVNAQVTYNTQVYAAGQEFWCSATNTWQPVSTSILPGVFTNAQMNDPIIFTTTGGGSCNPFSLTGTQLTDGVASCVNIPTSGVTNGFTNGFAAYMKNPNANNAGLFGWTGVVGMYSLSICSGGSATNTRCWGANFSAADSAGNPAVLFGNEYDLQVNNNTTNGYGTLYSMRGNGVPSADTFPTIAIQAASGTGRFTSGLECQPGSLSGSNFYPCVQMQPQETGNGHDSSVLSFRAQSTVLLGTSIYLTQDNFLLTGTPAVSIDNVGVGATEGIGIALKATATLIIGTLVKIDTANADSVVICTTADTICHGFVAGGSAYCLAGGTHCAIITMPGSKAVATLGTGTCSIGNFVIVDTTTNGRVKCTASQPAVGATMGIALSAQAVVGNTVDILTKFQ